MKPGDLVRIKKDILRPNFAKWFISYAKEGKIMVVLDVVNEMYAQVHRADQVPCYINLNQLEVVNEDK